MIFLLANKHKHNKLRQVKTHIGISIDIEYIGFAYACTYGWCLNICRRRFTGHKRCYAVWMKTRLTKNLCSSGVPQSMSKKKWKRIPNCNINYRSSLHVMFPHNHYNRWAFSDWAIIWKPAQNATFWKSKINFCWVARPVKGTYFYF